MDNIYTLFLIGHEFKNLRTDPGMSKIFECFDFISQGMGKHRLIRDFSSLSLKKVLVPGDFISYNDLNTSFLICLDSKGNIDYSALSESFLSFFEKFNNLKIDIQLIIPESAMETKQKEEELKDKVIDINALATPYGNVYIRRINALMSVFGLCKVIH